MAQYKVPQDVEADDKLLGPFSFRQFVYIMIAGGLIASCFLLWNIFPLLIMIPIPIIIFLGILALPIKKDQPMETYLSAVVDFYLKPQKRYWMPGQTDIPISITAPKQTEENRTKDLSQEEASHRLSFLANIVDTEGHAIKDSNLSEEFEAQNADAQDMFESGSNYTLDRTLEQSTENRHNQIVAQMRNAINQQQAAPAAAPQAITHQYTAPQTPQPAVQQVAQALSALPTPATAPEAVATPAAPTVAPPIPPSPTAVQAPVPPAVPQAPVAPPAPAPDPKATSAAVIQPDLEAIHELYVEEEGQKKESNPEEEYEEVPLGEQELPGVDEEDAADELPIEENPQELDASENAKDDQEVYISLH